MAEHLFAYGTLRPGHAPAEIADVVARLQPLGKGVIKGTRYELPDFPAVPLQQRSTGKVQGQVFALPDNPDTLARLDAYEGFDPQRPDQSLFRRVKTPVTLHDGTRKTCWVYLYNRPIPKKLVTRTGLLRRLSRASTAARPAR